MHLGPSQGSGAHHHEYALQGHFLCLPQVLQHRFSRMRRLELEEVVQAQEAVRAEVEANSNLSVPSEHV